MLKNIYIESLLFLLFLLGSCQKELLHPIPESILTTSNAYNTSKDINLAVLGIYDDLQSRVPTDFVLMEAPSDNAWATSYATAPGIGQINNLTVSVDNPGLNDFWKNTYNGIFRANTVLANINNPTDYTGTQKDQYTGEAKFMRALFYFDLVRIFGGVPAITSVITANEAKKIPRATEQDIYDAIVNDLEDAVTKLPKPSGIEYGRASKGAAVALLAKVYVYLKDWNNAKKYLDELFSSEFSYSLVTNYASLFLIATEKNSESIFSLPYVEGTDGQTLTSSMAPAGGVYQTIAGGNTNIRPTWSLRTSFEEGDSRFPVTINEEHFPYVYKQGDPAIWYPFFKKWVVPTANQTSSGLDIPLLRLADMVLLNAEVLYNLNQQQQALDQINLIRERAFGNPSHDYLIADISSPELFMDKLLLERRLELANENNRWFDLVRTGRFTTVLQNIKADYNSPTGDGIIIKAVHAEPYMKYFPIPNEQIQLANPGVLIQNEKY